MIAGIVLSDLDVVDHGGAAIQADNGGERGLDARIAALAFERFHQRRFFAAFVGAGAGVRHQIEIETAALNILAEITLCIGFGDGGVHDVDDVAILAADIDVALVRADGVAGDNHALDQLVRDPFPSAGGLCTCRVRFRRRWHRMYFGLAVSLGTKLHFMPIGKPAPPRPRRLDFFTSSMIASGVIAQGFLKRLVAFGFQVRVDLARIFHAEALADDDTLARQAVRARIPR